MLTEDDLIAKLQAEILYKERLIHAFRADRRVQELVAVLREQKVLQIYPDSTMERELNVSVAGDREKLKNIWHALRTAGWALAPGWERPAARASSWSGRFFGGLSEFSIWLTFTSTVCRRVQVGTKMEEVPVYEVQCDDSSPALEPEATLEPAAPAAPTELVVSAAQDDEIPF